MENCFLFLTSSLSPCLSARVRDLLLVITFISCAVKQSCLFPWGAFTSEKLPVLPWTCPGPCHPVQALNCHTSPAPVHNLTSFWNAPSPLLLLVKFDSSAFQLIGVIFQLHCPFATYVISLLKWLASLKWFGKKKEPSRLIFNVFLSAAYQLNFLEKKVCLTMQKSKRKYALMLLCIDKTRRILCNVWKWIAPSVLGSLAPVHERWFPGRLATPVIETAPRTVHAWQLLSSLGLWGLDKRDKAVRNELILPQDLCLCN